MLQSHQYQKEDIKILHFKNLDESIDITSILCCKSIIKIHILGTDLDWLDHNAFIKNIKNTEDLLIRKTTKSNTKHVLWQAK